MAKQDEWTAPNSLTSDLDFGSSPTLFPQRSSGTATPMVGACNKNGIFYAWRQGNLAAGPVWSRQVGESGVTGTARASRRPRTTVERTCCWWPPTGRPSAAIRCRRGPRAGPGHRSRRLGDGTPCPALGSPTVNASTELVAVPLFGCGTGILARRCRSSTRRREPVGRSLPAAGSVFAQPVFAAVRLRRQREERGDDRVCPWPRRVRLGDPGGRRARGAVTHPDRVVFPEPGSPSSTSCATTSPWRTARCAGSAAGRWSSSGSSRASTEEAFFQKRAPDQAARLRRRRRAAVRLRDVGQGGVVHDAAGAGLGGQPRLHRPEPAPRPAEDLDHPDELRIDLDPVPGVAVGADRRRRAASPATCSRTTGWSAGRRRRASRGFHVYARIEPRGRSRGAARGARRSRARSNAARRTWRPPGGGRRSGTGSSSTSTRTPRTARWRRPTPCARRTTRACRRR